MMRASSVFLCGLLLGCPVIAATSLGCGSDETGAGGTGGTDAVSSAASTSAGDETSLGTQMGDIRVTLLLNELSLLGVSGPSTSLNVFVTDPAGKGISGATVTASTTGGAPVTLTEGSPGRFSGMSTSDYARDWDFSISHPTGSRTGVHLVGPSFPTVSFMPAPSVGVATTMQWTPNGEKGVTAQPSLIGDSTWTGPIDQADSGSAAIPAAQLSHAGMVTFQLQLDQKWNDGTDFTAEFLVDAQQTITLN